MLLRNSQLRWGMLVRNSSGRGPMVVRSDMGRREGGDRTVLYLSFALRERALFRVRSRMMDDRRTGRRFRRRLLAVMLAAGLLPLAGGGLVVGFGLSRMLSLSLGRLDPLLE